MSAQTYEPLRAVPMLDQQQRVAWLLVTRDHARRAFDVVLTAPRRAAGYVVRLFRGTALHRLLSWGQAVARRVTDPLLARLATLGRGGWMAAVAAGFTSPLFRRGLGMVTEAVLCAVGWLARTAYSGLDRGLRIFGRPGNTAADRLFAGVVGLSGKIAAVAAPVVHRVARLSDPGTAQARLLSGLARSYVLHRALRALIGNGFVRLLVEGMLLPALVDSRIAIWGRQQLRLVRSRALSLQEQADVLSQPSVQPSGVVAGDVSPDADGEMPMAAGEHIPMPLWVVQPDEDEPVPGNRAERRAQQRHNKPRQNKTKPAPGQ